MLLCLLLGLLLVGGYFLLPDEPREAVRERVSEAITNLRDHPQTPPPLERVLTTLTEILPGPMGPSVAYELPPGDRSFLLGGLPTGGNWRLLENRGYLSAYDEVRRNPAWVAYRLFTVEPGPSPERPSRFLSDRRTRARIEHADYTNSGFDRGHLAPNHAIAMCYGEDAQRETFLLSNIVPQRPELNQQFWRKLEERVFQEYAFRLEEVWVLTGPVYDEEVERLRSGIEIPDAFFKIILDETPDGHLRTLAFLVPQEVSGDDRPGRYLVSIDAIEGATGYDFLPAFPDAVEEALESAKASRLW